MTKQTTIDERVEITTRYIKEAVEAAGMVLTGDLRVSEKDAAHLLGYSPGHLKGLRQQGKGPANYQRGLNGSRISYRLNDLSLWIEITREDW